MAKNKPTAHLTFRGEKREVSLGNSVLYQIEKDGIDLRNLEGDPKVVTNVLKIGYHLLRVKEPFEDVLDDLPTPRQIGEALELLNAEPGEPEGDG